MDGDGRERERRCVDLLHHGICGCVSSSASSVPDHILSAPAASTPASCGGAYPHAYAALRRPEFDLPADGYANRGTHGDTHSYTNPAADANCGAHGDVYPPADANGDTYSSACAHGDSCACGACAHGDTYRYAYASYGPAAEFYSSSRASGHPGPCSCRYSNPYADSYAHAHGYARSDVHADSGPDPHGYAHAHGYARSDVHADSRPDPHGYTHAHGYAYTYS